MEFAKTAMSKTFVDIQQAGIPHSLLILSAAAVISIVFIILPKIGRAKVKYLPPGNMGLPFLGETTGFMGALKSHKSNKWVADKVDKYGPVFKTSLMGCPTAVLTGQEGNRFLLQVDYNTIIHKQPTSFLRILGTRNIFDLEGEEHRRIRSAIMSFMNPDALQKCMGRMVSVMEKHFLEHWDGKESIEAYPAIKQLTFDMAADILFGLKDLEERKTLREQSIAILKGLWSLPVNLPGTIFRAAMNARGRVCKRLLTILKVRREEIAEGKVSPQQDLMSWLITMKDDHGNVLTDEEIVDNLMVLMIGGHETTAVLLSHIVRFLSLHPDICQNILLEKEQVLASKLPNETLEWNDIQKMDYTLKVVLETLRLVPPTFGSFRQAIKDVEYNGYTIPKGWQLLWETSTTHGDDEIFKQPNKFDPAHFDNKIPPYNFIPFGGGCRHCPGSNFAKLQAIIFTQLLIAKYKWSLMFPEEKIVCEPFPVPARGLPINLQAKEN